MRTISSGWGTCPWHRMLPTGWRSSSSKEYRTPTEAGRRSDMKKTAALIVLLALASAGPVTLLAQEAQQPLALTLDEAIAMALQQNPAHQATQEKEAEARALARQAFSRF